MRYKRGYSVVEVLLAGSIFALAVAGIVSAIILSQRNNQASIAQSQALEMAQEGIEALRSIRNRDYTLLINTSTPAALTRTGSQWSIVTNPTTDIDKLTDSLRTRRITIATDTTALDSKLITVTVTYQINPAGDTKTITLSETLANILTNKPSGTTATSQNYQLRDDNFGNAQSTFKDTTP
jgi:Tfp pilus assembly protein PilV